MGQETRVYRRERIEGAWDHLMWHAGQHGLTKRHIEAGKQLIHEMQCHWLNELGVLRRRELQRPALEA